MSGRSVKVAVIGAGVSGLVAARELQRQNHNVVVFEQNSRIGGAWVYNPETESDPLSQNPTRKTIHSSLYLSLRTNLPRATMSFLDYPFLRTESDPRTFPGHEEVLRFLEKFAREFGIGELTRLNARVVKVEKREREGWVVETERDDGKVEREGGYEAVVVCTGHNSEAKAGEIQGIHEWRGRCQMHSHNYRVPEPFHGQIVLLVGYGPSAFDISRDLLPVAKEVHIAAKENRFGVKFKNVIYHGMIKCVNKDGSIAFQDGSSIFADSIIHCTGYRYHFPFLETNGVVTVEDKCVGPLYKHIFPPALAPWLSFIGIVTEEPIYLLAELQAKWVAKVLSGEILLPTEKEMMDSVQDIYLEMEKNALPKTCALSLRPLQVDYKHWLVTQIGLPPLEEWRENLLAEVFKKLVELPESYRDQWDDAYWDAIIETTPAS
ncbi:hypothetical protein RIF29_13658 [Crotalaria pallida]|uniref:Flavin-containing monooxygenase n=1 Tax=Crotalaria pallida TaxID=3830 RepID=A0AAN9P3G2_CROPI